MPASREGRSLPLAVPYRTPRRGKIVGAGLVPARLRNSQSREKKTGCHSLISARSCSILGHVALEMTSCWRWREASNRTIGLTGFLSRGIPNLSRLPTTFSLADKTLYQVFAVNQPHTPDIPARPRNHQDNTSLPSMLKHETFGVLALSILPTPRM